MSNLKFKIEKKIPGTLGRAGVITTPHGEIKTPAFVTVGTKATVKALTPEQVHDLGAQVVLANTYHLYLQPGDDLVARGGGLHGFMNWSGPMMTDSGGFQAFSLGAALGKGINKFLNKSDNGGEKAEVLPEEKDETELNKIRAQITEEGVRFKSIIDGSSHFFTPERSMEIQHNLGADIIFAFDECTAPNAPYDYQKEAMERTHRWAERSLSRHKSLDSARDKKNQALFGIVQGGRHKDLREASARFIGGLDFDGFGIGGSFDKEDMDTAVGWVNAILPEDKPRHLLGIGDPGDIVRAIEQGCDTFDCVAPTRMARNGGVMTSSGRLNLNNAKYKNDFSVLEDGCGCYTCATNIDGTAKYSRAYLAHLFRAGEMLAATLVSIHNLYWLIHFVARAREAILASRWEEWKKEVQLKK